MISTWPSVRYHHTDFDVFKEEQQKCHGVKWGINMSQNCFFFFNISHQENLKLMKLNLKLKLNKIVSKQMKNRAGGFYSYLKKKTSLH